MVTWSWNSNTLATWCEELTHWKRPWCWERLKAGEEGDNRGWDGRMASLTQWSWVWVNSRSCWWTRRPGVPQSMGSQRVGHNWATELNCKHQETILYLWHFNVCVCVCVCAKLLQPCLTLSDPMDCSLPGSSIQRILQTRILEWVAVSSFSGSSLPRDQALISLCLLG